MRKQDVIKHFGSPAETARKLGLTKQAINQWPDDMIPERSALLVESVTKGKLRADREAYRLARIERNSRRAA